MLQYPVNFKQSNTKIHSDKKNKELQYPVNFKQSNTHLAVHIFLN